jgi:hypothetical protein
LVELYVTGDQSNVTKSVLEVSVLLVAQSFDRRRVNSSEKASQMKTTVRTGRALYVHLVPFFLDNAMAYSAATVFPAEV